LGILIGRISIEMRSSGRVRQPREDEILLMNLLASGPCPLGSGPVGRCSSRGWIRFVKLDARSRGIFELTPLGRAQLEEHMGSVRASTSDEEDD
jgi:hypothetical protein